MPTSSVHVTTLLNRDGISRHELMDDLVPLVYDKLRLMAHRQLAKEHGARTLNTTGLVHEAYMKLVDESTVPLINRRYFFGAAARAMRQVLVDSARKRKRQKRGGGVQDLPLDESKVDIDTFSEELLALDESLERLAGEHPRSAQVVECRFFAGMSVENTAELLDVSPRTIKRDWMLARAWLHRDLNPHA